MLATWPANRPNNFATDSERHVRPAASVAIVPFSPKPIFPAAAIRPLAFSNVERSLDDSFSVKYVFVVDDDHASQCDYAVIFVVRNTRKNLEFLGIELVIWSYD